MSGKIWHARPLGAYRLASELRENGYNVLVIDFFSRWLQDFEQLSDLLTKILSTKTLFVGYSGTFFARVNNSHTRRFFNYKDYYNREAESHWPSAVDKIALLNQFIKKLAPHCSIFYGGSKANVINDQLKNSGVDYVVQGLADGIIVDILQRLQQKQPIPCEENDNTTVKSINMDPLGKSLNFSSTTTQFHHSDFIATDEILPLETSRGCLFKCKFCAYPLLGRKKNDPEYHKKISVLTQELVQNFDKFGVRRYMIVDDTFNESTEKLQKLHDSIKSSEVDIEFSCYLRLDLLERYPEQIELLYDMGMRSCYLGIETLNAQSARSIGKSSDIKNVKFALEKARSVWQDDVAIYASFIAGLPHETEDTLNDWMQWVYDRHDLIHSFRIAPLGLNQDFTWPSEIGKNPTKFGYQIIKNNWINNQHMTQETAGRLSSHWMAHAWQTGRLRVAGWEMMGMQNLGYSRHELQKYTLDKLPVADFATRSSARFSEYKHKLLNYIGQTE
jgi:hypothetical protein